MVQKTRCILVDKKRGVFLGVKESIAFFSKLDPFGVPLAYAFENKIMADLFIESFLKDKDGEFETVEITAPIHYEKYIHYFDIIKSKKLNGIYDELLLDMHDNEITDSDKRKTLH